MLAELLVWAGVRAAPEARRLGYAKAAVSLWSRRRRCAGAWREHEANSRDFVMRVAASCRRRDTIWLLGGGTLADLPLAQLSDMFRRVLVFDIALLGMARRQVRKYPNVELRLADITGIVAPLAEWRSGTPLPIPSEEAMMHLDAVPPDVVLSLNMLSQLPLLPMQYVERRGIGRREAEVFGQTILRAHLAGLAAFGCPAGLVGDATRIWRSRSGEAVMTESAVLGIPLPAPEREWYWPVAPRGEIDPETALEMKVRAAMLDGH